MFFDLNVPIQKSTQKLNVSKKSKQSQQDAGVTWTAAELSAIEARIDLLFHCKSIFRFLKHMTH